MSETRSEREAARRLVVRWAHATLENREVVERRLQSVSDASEAANKALQVIQLIKRDMDLA